MNTRMIFVCLLVVSMVTVSCMLGTTLNPTSPETDDLGTVNVTVKIESISEIQEMLDGITLEVSLWAMGPAGVVEGIKEEMVIPIDVSGSRKESIESVILVWNLPYGVCIGKTGQEKTSEASYNFRYRVEPCSDQPLAEVPSQQINIYTTEGADQNPVPASIVVRLKEAEHAIYSGEHGHVIVDLFGGYLALEDITLEVNRPERFCGTLTMGDDAEEGVFFYSISFIECTPVGPEG